MDWSAIASISAVILAAIFAGIGYMVRLNKGRKRVLCITLYHLLEIWHKIRISTLVNPKIFVEIYLEEITRQNPEIKITKSDREIVRGIFTKMWSEMLSTIDGNCSISIEKRFNSSVDELAEFDPILAFELSANQPLKSFMSFLNGYFDELEEAAKSDESEIGVEDIELMFHKMKGFLHDDLLKGLERDLMWLSFQISTPMFVRTTRKIIKKRRSGIEEAEKLIRTLVSQMMVQGVNSSNNGN